MALSLRDVVVAAAASCIRQCNNLISLRLYGPDFENGYSYENAMAIPPFPEISEATSIMAKIAYQSPLYTVPDLHLDILYPSDFFYITRPIHRRYGPIRCYSHPTPLSELKHLSISVRSIIGPNERHEHDGNVLDWLSQSSHNLPSQRADLIHISEKYLMHFIKMADSLESLQLRCAKIMTLKDGTDFVSCPIASQQLRTLELSRVRFKQRYFMQVLEQIDHSLATLWLDQVEVETGSWAVLFRKMAEMQELKNVRFKLLGYVERHTKYSPDTKLSDRLASKQNIDHKDLERLLQIAQARAKA
jgi:hypothetical protein